jgi:hypothetical protein
MRELNMHVSDQLTAESPVESYVYRFDKKYRLLFCEAKQNAGNHNYRRTWFQYDRKGRVKTMKIDQVDQGDTFSSFYKYTYSPLENGLTKVSRSKQIVSDTSVVIDSAYVNWDQRGRVVEKTHFWGTEPNKSAYKYTFEGDTLVVRSVQYDAPIYYPKGEKYNREQEYREVRNANKKVVFIEHRYIKILTDCGVGMPLNQMFEYDSLGRLEAQWFTAIGYSYSFHYSYPHPNEYVILKSDQIEDARPCAHYWCNYRDSQIRILDESNGQTIILNWTTGSKRFQRRH